MAKTEEITSSEGPEVLKAMEDKIVSQAPEVADEIVLVEAEVHTSIFGIPLPGAIFKPGMKIEELQKMREAAANNNDPSLIQEKKAA